MTTLTFVEPIDILKLSDVLKKLDNITPDTSLLVGLKDNAFVTKIIIPPAVSADKTDDMKKLADVIGAVLEM